MFFSKIENDHNTLLIIISGNILLLYEAEWRKRKRKRKRLEAALFREVEAEAVMKKSMEPEAVKRKSMEAEAEAVKA